ncbi:U3 small nucleolar RNA-associated protein 25 [Selaginella moellendorffii]|uniref:U3 small nucleolar RNA-associated protein 25 n=1 Tax=Selaginella moellendorffii TaxID=88036 RepID=UPI000D1CFCF4|nr:U3 small nucleolar RNA-associated protein 25 [Selaginella moellendorffii]|eukprot:XP_024536917.1 U3 small nucleolar RNA-associated protein 25 [Selaginella moellendorffii]
MALKRKRNGAVTAAAAAAAGDRIVSRDLSRDDVRDPSPSTSEALDAAAAYSTLIATLKSCGRGGQTCGFQTEERDHSSDDVPNADTERNGGLSNKEDTEPDQSDGERQDDDGDEILEEQVDDEDLDTSTVDEFKVHLDYTLGEGEIAELDSAKSKVHVEHIASGFLNSKWIVNKEKFPKAESKLSHYNVKARLRRQWENVAKRKFGDFQSEHQCQFYSLCNSYYDILHTRKGGKKLSSETMDACLLHIINHVLKTKDLVSKNNDKLHNREPTGVFDSPRDQGFTRPKVLVLLPMRNLALKLVKRLLALAPPTQKATVDFKQRFFDDFGLGEEDKDDKQASKPADFKFIFDGNNDDHFRIGIKFTRKAVKLYSDFLSSDIILASPLGLTTSIQEAKADTSKNIDFLSSIEILVIDFADVIMMQNWSHVVSLFDHINKMPSKQHDTDIMRIREWYLDGHARYFRQTIFLSSYPDAAINALFFRQCVNHTGKAKLQCRYDGVLSNIMLQVRQVYERVQCESITDVDDARFEFFTKQLFPRIKESLQGGTMLFVRSYFDFVRLRNFLKAESASFCLLGEYTKSSDVSRSRTWFFHGQRRIMLYTERAHFYHRYQIRGIRELIFYSLPDHANFYSEMVNMLGGGQNPSCTVIYSKFDKLQLERIVGTQRAQKLLASKETMMFF